MRRILKYLLLVVAAALISPCSGETVTNCLRLITHTGNNWSLKGTLPLFEGLTLPVEKMGNGWIFMAHHMRGWGYVATRKSMPAVSYLDFSEQLYTVDIIGTNDFYGLFNWHEDEPRTDLTAYNGWVHLRYENGELKIVNSAMGTNRGERVFFEDDPDFHPAEGGGATFSFKYRIINGGSAVALVQPCLPADTEGAVVIPDTIGGLPVTLIDSGAFMGCWKITGVVVPSSVTRINSRAFADCLALTNVVLPPTLEWIDGEAFMGCREITDVVVPSSVRYIYPRTFADCVSLTNVVLPATLERIGGEAFHGCTSLAEICLPGGATLGSDVVPETCRVTCRYPWDVVPQEAPMPEGDPVEIKEREWLVEQLEDHVELARKCLPDMTSGVVSIPEKIGGMPVTSINQDAFYGNEWMTGLVIPNTVSNIGDNAIAHTRNLRSLVIPDSVTNLGYLAVRDGYSLCDLVVGGGVVEMGEYAFANNDSLTNVVIRDGVRAVSRGAFSGCRSLKNLVLPPSLESIAKNAFAGCSALESVSLLAGTRVESGAFPSGCRVSYRGPKMLLQGVSENEWHASYRPLLAVSDFDRWRSALCVNAQLGEADSGERTDPRYDLEAILALGLSPVRYEMQNNGTLDVFFARPQVKLVNFSPDRMNLVAQVIPATGSEIVRTDDIPQAVDVEVAETASELSAGNGDHLSIREGVSVDAPDYLKNGEIRIGLEGVLEKGASRFFRLGFRP